MKSYVLHIGVIDRDGNQHLVSFGPGVNVVTGKSSTGKSALIEIFDYCFGNSDFTIPDGVITECAELYFVVLSVNEDFLVLARKYEKKIGLVALEKDSEELRRGVLFDRDYFSDKTFIPLPNFLIEVRRNLGVDIIDTDENLEAKRIKKKKAPAPSVRSISSYILQHQNLVANKHALFYRFDEHEKREQAIEHLKIFTGWVTAEYFLLKQQLETLQSKKKCIEIQIQAQQALKGDLKIETEVALRQFIAVTGENMDCVNIGAIYSNPKLALEKIEQFKIVVNPTSDKHIKIRQDLNDKLAVCSAEHRSLQNKRNDIRESIKNAEGYSKETESIDVPSKVILNDDECPFCRGKEAPLVGVFNKLYDAIDWLNGELSKTHYVIDSFRTQESDTENQLQQKAREMGMIQCQIAEIDKTIKQLDSLRSQTELAYSAKAELVAKVKDIVKIFESKYEEELKEIEAQIKEISNKLKESFNIDRQIQQAESYVDDYMKSLSKKLDFEESYRPVNLKFDFNSFDLWNEKSDGRKVFLRAMGSGANWLSCHVCLFLALQRYFCSLGSKCAVPSILFLDQPSQVYFPVTDTETEFQPNELAKREGDIRKRGVDADMAAVTKLFDALVEHCNTTESATGIRPQIIVTDHADHLNLLTADFESLVNGRRWRKPNEGFIKIKGAPEA